MGTLCLRLPALRLRQPIGEFYLVAMRARDLVDISHADVRRLVENELDRYMGINRRLSKSRVKQIANYVDTYDATFPTSIILAVEDKNAFYDEDDDILELFAENGEEISDIATIIDGQHRIAGLEELANDVDFDLGVVVFLGADVSTHANVFATVNLAQTKVNRSLAYDLLDYQKFRSPQKSAHMVAVALDRFESGPLYRRIKRLGTATPGRKNEAITQAVVVEMLLSFMSSDPMSDRDVSIRRKDAKEPSLKELRNLPFRQLYFDKKEREIALILLRYFEAVRDRWPNSWNDIDRPGNVLPKTNGFRALMRFLKIAYLSIVGDKIGSVPTRSDFYSILQHVELDDGEFDLETFRPGTSGEAKLVEYLKASLSGDP